MWGESGRLAGVAAVVGEVEEGVGVDEGEFVGARGVDGVVDDGGGSPRRRACPAVLYPTHAFS